MDLELYINGNRVDLSEGTYIQWTWERTDLDDPAVVKNSYTQSISLPATENNIRIMSCFGRLDFVQPLQGMRFQSKIPFALYDKNHVIQQQGYCKVDEVTRNKHGIASYKVSLYGGLGSLFYSMMYDSEGNELNLSALEYEGYEDGSFPMTADNVVSNWQALDNDAEPTFAFAVCYNGYPKCKFDANKAMYKPAEYGSTSGIYDNLYTYKFNPEDNKAYTANRYGGYALLELGNKHTDIEMQDLRAYLLRPCISVTGMVKAIASASATMSSYTLVVEDAVYELFNNNGQPLYMTLPMFDRDTYAPKIATLEQVLAGTKSPASYLISIAKVFGLCFLVDEAGKQVTLCRRADFYDGEVVDLSARVDADGTMQPFTFSAKTLRWSYKKYFGKEATDYESEQGEPYASQTLNTGYEFNNDTTSVLKDINLNGGADVLEGSTAYTMYHYYLVLGGNFYNYFKLPFTESVKWKLYLYVGSDEEGADDKGYKSIDCEPTTAEGFQEFTYRMTDGDYNDVFPKLQLHGDDNKAEDGDGVLLWFTGFKEMPSKTWFTHTIQTQFEITDDNDAMLSANGGVPCWQVSWTYGWTHKHRVSSLPAFRRFCLDARGEIYKTLEFGKSKVIYTDEGYANDVQTIFQHDWETFTADIYSENSQVYTCKVDLSGLTAGQDLLRHFYYFGGAVWVLNKVSNYVAGGDELTECEFIKVQNKTNYTG